MMYFFGWFCLIAATGLGVTRGTIRGYDADTVRWVVHYIDLDGNHAKADLDSNELSAALAHNYCTGGVRYETNRCMRNEA